MSLFGLGNIRGYKKELSYLQEMYGELQESYEEMYSRENILRNKCLALEKSLIERDKHLSNLHAEMVKKNTTASLLGKELKDSQELVAVLEEAVKTTKIPKRKRRKALNQRTGFTKVSAEEKATMVDMFKNGFSNMKIAQHVGRAESTVSSYLHKYYEETQGGRE